MKEQIKQLEHEFNLDITIFNDTQELYMYNSKKTRTFKLPKKVTIEWIIKKVDSFVNSEYKNLTNIFSKLDLKGLVYPTTYGIGYSCSFNDATTFKNNTDKIELELNNLGLDYKIQFSDARYCLRYIISTKASNLDIVKNLK